MFVRSRIYGLNGRASSRGKETLNHVLNQWIESISFESALYDIKEKIGVQYYNTTDIFPFVLSFHVNTSHQFTLKLAVFRNNFSLCAVRLHI